MVAQVKGACPDAVIGEKLVGFKRRAAAAAHSTLE